MQTQAAEVNRAITSRDGRDRLCLEQVEAGYGKKQILRNVSISVQAGEIVALIGPNGAGKSTVLRVAAGLLTPWKGSVRLDGRDITLLPAYRRAHRGVSYLVQGGEVFPSLTVQENLEMGLLTLPPAERAEALESVLSLIPALRERLPHRAGLLSGGQRQALALGMVLVKRPKVLLLDEPSAGLAPILVQEILSKIREINQQWGLPVLLVEQNVREALSVAHRAVVLANGEIAMESDHPQELLTSGHLERLFLGEGAKRKVSNLGEEVSQQ